MFLFYFSDPNVSYAFGSEVTDLPSDPDLINVPTTSQVIELTQEKLKEKEAYKSKLTKEERPTVQQLVF